MDNGWSGSGWQEFAVLNKIGFKILGYDGEKWYNIHTGDTAAPPSVNPERWYMGINSYPVAEYISLKSKINYWKGKKNKKKGNPFKPEKFEEYNKNFDNLMENFEEEIYEELSKVENKKLSVFLPKNIRDIFIF